MVKQVSRDHLLLMLIVSTWGLTFTGVKIASAEMSLLSIFFIRGLVALVTLVTVYAMIERQWHFPLADLGMLAILGILASTINPLASTIGIVFTSASNAALLTSTSPIFGLIAAAIFLRQNASLKRWLGVFIALSGVFLVIAGGKADLSFGSETLLGDLIVLVSPLAWALYSVLSRPFLKRYSALQFSTYASAIGLCIGLAFTAAPAAAQDWSKVSPIAWAAIAFCGLSFGLTHIVWNAVISRTGPATGLIFMYFVPVVAVVASFLFLKESMTLLQMAGAVVVLAGVNLANRQ